MKAEWLLFWVVVRLVGGVGGELIPLSDKRVANVLFSKLGRPITHGLGGINFNVPDEFLREEHRSNSLSDRIDSNSPHVFVPKEAVKKVPDLSSCEQLGQNEAFSPIIPKHKEMAKKVIDAFLDQRTYEDFIASAIYARSHLNKYLFLYSYSLAILLREDTQHLSLPNAASIMPEQFIDSQILQKIQERASPFEVKIKRDISEADSDKESRLDYFREDIGLNLYNYNQQMKNPSFGITQAGNINRKGELFYNMIYQESARYDCERLSNGLNRMIPFENFEESISEHYDAVLGSPTYTPRPANLTMQDVSRPDAGLHIEMDSMERWRERIYQAISEGQVLLENGSYIPLTEENGIDVLGNLVESSDLSLNSDYYGDLYNSGNLALAFITDPKYEKKETYGYMASPTVALRDPIFYRWHRFVDNIFQQYKGTLDPYTSQELGFPNVSIKSMQVLTDGLKEPNTLTTFWDKSKLDISRGVNFESDDPVYVEVTHLQHKPFVYKIEVQNNGTTKNGTVRLFMAPRFDESGNAIPLNEQRTLVMEMDSFPVNLNPGQNIYERDSQDSSVTVPHKQTFEDLSDTQESTSSGCGLPQHLLIPKGTMRGLEYELFVIVTKIEDEDQIEVSTTQTSRNALTLCEGTGERNPDQRPMGFPFDRPPSSSISTFDDFILLGTGNMGSTAVTIYHN